MKQAPVILRWVDKTTQNVDTMVSLPRSEPTNVFATKKMYLVFRVSQVAELEEELSRQIEHRQYQEAEARQQRGELELALEELRRERDEFHHRAEDAIETISTLKRKEEEGIRRQRCGGDINERKVILITGKLQYADYQN